MIDTITYVADTKAFIAELLDAYQEYAVTDENGNVIYTPLHVVRARNGLASLAVCRLTDEQLAAIEPAESIENLGYYDTILDETHPDHDPGLLALYMSVYDFETPVEYVYADGVTQQYYPSQKIGVIA